MAITKLTHVTIIVRDQNEALAWYTDKFGFEKHTDDAKTAPGYRWLTVAPKGQIAPEIALFQARDEREQTWVGQGTLWVLETDDCRTTCRTLAGKGVKILTEPQDLPWGVSAIVEDLYGNPYNLLQPRR
jgi:predicted enzyme related to lactoylglutathione lyase